MSPAAPEPVATGDISRSRHYLTVTVLHPTCGLWLPLPMLIA
jgi:hypothetical protein